MKNLIRIKRETFRLVSPIGRSTYVLLSTISISIITIVFLFLDEPPSSGLMLYLTDIVIEYITSGGYVVIALLMVLDGACIPIPSEIVLAFSGFLVSTSKFDMWITLASSTLGSLLGSLIAYVAGLKLGRELIKKYGRFLMLEEKTLNTVERWFRKYGKVTVLVSRFIPGARTVVSIPAGIGKMQLSIFIILTVIGSVLWNYTLIYLGVKLGENWYLVETFIDRFDIPIALSLVVIIGYVLLFYNSYEESSGNDNRP